MRNNQSRLSLPRLLPLHIALLIQALDTETITTFGVSPEKLELSSRKIYQSNPDYTSSHRFCHTVSRNSRSSIASRLPTASRCLEPPQIGNQPAVDDAKGLRAKIGRNVGGGRSRWVREGNAQARQILNLKFRVLPSARLATRMETYIISSTWYQVYICVILQRCRGCMPWRMVGIDTTINWHAIHTNTAKPLNTTILPPDDLFLAFHNLNMCGRPFDCLQVLDHILMHVSQRKNDVSCILYILVSTNTKYTIHIYII